MIRHSVASILGCILAAASLFVLNNVEAAGQPLPRILVFEEAVRGIEDTELRWPVAVAASSVEEFVVADAKPPRLVVFRKVGLSWQLAQTVRLPAAPVGLAHDGSRYLVSLRGGEGMFAFEGDQLLMRKIGIPDSVVPGALAPRAGGGILLYDFAGGRVLKLDSKGTRMAETAIEGRVTAVAEGPAGVMWVAVGEQAAVLRFDPNGALTARVEIPGEAPVPAWPAGLAIGSDGAVAVIDRHGGRILMLDDDGSPIGVGSRRGSEPGLLRFPRGVAMLPDGRLVVADEGNGRAQLFRRTDVADTP